MAIPTSTLGPPVWPSKSDPATDDELLLAGLAERLGLDEESWRRLVDEAAQLAARADFQLLEDGLTRLLSSDGTLDQATLEKAHHIVTTGRPPMHAAQASSRTLSGRGTFALLIDTYAKRRDKARMKSGAFKHAIAARQAGGSAIPVLGMTGTRIGEIDPGTLKVVPGMGLFAKGALHLERNEAMHMLRSVAANNVTVEYADDLASLTLIPKLEAIPKKKFTFSDQLEQIKSLDDAIHEDDDPVDPRAVIRVGVEAGIRDPLTLQFYDEMRAVLSHPAPTIPLEQLRAESMRVARDEAA